MKKDYILINSTNGFSKPTKYSPSQKRDCITAHISNYYNSNKFTTKNPNTIFGDIINTMISYQLIYNSYNEAREATINHYIIKSK